MTPDTIAERLCEALQWVIDHPGSVLLLVVLAFLFGTPAKRQIDGLVRVARVPAQFAEANLLPALRSTEPWSFSRLVGTIRSYLGPVLGRPAGALAGLVVCLAAWIRQAIWWPVEAIADAIPRLLAEALEPIIAALERAKEALRAGIASALESLRGRSTHSVGWRVIGACVYFAAACAFLYADFVLAVASDGKALGVPAQVPDWLQDVTLAFAISSFLSAFVLGLVLTDLLRHTHFSVFEDVGGWARAIFTGITVSLIAAFLVTGTFLAVWRADVLVRGWLEPESAKDFLRIALSAPVPLMLAATTLVGGAGVAIAWVVWIALLGLLFLAICTLQLSLEVAQRVLRPVAGILGGILRAIGVTALALAIIAISVALMGYLGFAAAAAGLALVIGFGTVGAWMLLWATGHVLVHVARFLALLGRAFATALQLTIDVPLYPTASIWNWLARSRWGQSVGLREIPYPDHRTGTRPPEPPDVSEAESADPEELDELRRAS